MARPSPAEVVMKLKLRMEDARRHVIDRWDDNPLPLQPTRAARHRPETMSLSQYIELSAELTLPLAAKVPLRHVSVHLAVVGRASVPAHLPQHVRVTLHQHLHPH